MASLGSAVLDLTADTSQLDSDMQSAEGTVDSSTSRMGSAIGGMAKAAGAALAAAGAAAVTGAWQTASYGDELDKTSSRLGIHTDALQDAQYWAEQNGVESSTLERAIGRLNQRVGEAARGNDQYADAFRDLGVDVKDAEGNIRDTEAVMGDTVDRLMEIEDPAERASAASEVFGDRVARDLQPALEDGSLTLDEATAAMDEHGRMSEEQIEQSARFQDAWHDITTSVQSTLQDAFTPVMEFMAERLFPTIEERVLPALRSFAEWIGPRMQDAGAMLGAMWDEYAAPALNALSDWWDEHGDRIMGMIRRLGEVISDNMKPALIGLAAVVGGVVVPAFAAKAATLAAAAAPYFAVAAAIGGLVAALVWAYEESETFRDVVDRVWEAVQSVVTSVIDAVEGAISHFVTAATALWDRWGDTIMSVAESVWDTIMGVIDGALDFIMGIFEVFAGLFTGDWERLWEGARQAADGIWSAIMSVIEGVIDTIWSIIKGTLESIRGTWESAWDTVRDFVSDAWDGIRDGVSDGIDRVLEFISELPGRILDTLGDLGSLLLDAGRDIISGLMDGIRDRLSALGDVMGDVASTVRDALPFSPAKYGPLRDHPPDEAGESIAEMLAGGLEGGVGDVHSTMESMTRLSAGIEPAGGARDLDGSKMAHNVRRMVRLMEGQQRETLVTSLNRVDRLAV